MFRTKHCWNVPKIMQTGSGILKMWAFKRSGFTFLDHPVQHSKSGTCPLKSASFFGEIWTASDTWFLGPTWVSSQTTGVVRLLHRVTCNKLIFVSGYCIKLTILFRLCFVDEFITAKQWQPFFLTDWHTSLQYTKSPRNIMKSTFYFTKSDQMSMQFQCWCNDWCNARTWCV